MNESLLPHTCSSAGSSLAFASPDPGREVVRVGHESLSLHAGAEGADTVQSASLAQEVLRGATTMGFLTYDGEEVEIDDRTLTHLHIVIVQKLRRGESFAMSWALSSEVGSGRCSIWLHPSISIHFKFSGSRVPTINPEWLAELTVSANSSRGLIVTPEISSDLRQPFARVEPGNHGNRLELIQT